ncbi:MAG: outer membrane protein [Beijerinckiaceae bacterium]
MKLSHLSLAAVLAAGAMVSPAAAADLGQRFAKPTPVPAMPMFTWTGFYVGGNIGYGFNDMKTETVGTPLFNTLIVPGIVPSSLKTGRDGLLGGLQAGYNAQFGAFVAGVEADVMLTTRGRNAGFIGNPVFGTQLRTTASADMNYLGTLRGRLGFAADRLLVYATGGLAFADVETTTGVAGVQSPGFVWAGTKSDTRFGYTVGAGLEYALTQNWSIKGEYLYYDLGTVKQFAAGNGAVRGFAGLNGIDYASETKVRGNVVRAGVNYRF